MFKTRDPQSPNKGTSGFNPPVTPEIVLENFKLAIQEHNVDNYIRCFVDTTASSRRYSFKPSNLSLPSFINWTLEDERRYFQNLGQPVLSVPSLTLSNLSEINRVATATEYTAEYLLFYPHQMPDVSKQVRGFMHLYLEIDTKQRWAIYQWDDARTVSDSTWSYLKDRFDH